MMILDASDVAPAAVSLPWGDEIALKLQKKFYVRWEQFKDLALAIAACRHALDAGFLCVVVQEEASQASVWKALADTVPVATKEPIAEPQVAAPSKVTTYRGRVMTAAENPQPTSAASYSYRGRTINPTTDQAVQRPQRDDIFYRGRPLA